jgi:hypothetical protein
LSSIETGITDHAWSLEEIIILRENCENCE